MFYETAAAAELHHAPEFGNNSHVGTLIEKVTGAAPENVPRPPPPLVLLRMVGHRPYITLEHANGEHTSPLHSWFLHRR